MVTHSQEHTGDALLDRIQSNVLRLVQAVQKLLVDFEARRVVSLMLASDFTTTTATAAATKLTFAVSKGETWDVEFWGYAGCSSTNGMKYAIGCPAGSVLLGELESSSSNTAVANWGTEPLSASTMSSPTHVGATSTPRPDRINARVFVGADGAITLQVASATSGTTTTLTGKSYLRASKVTRV